jgi:hypothetical protein
MKMKACWLIVVFLISSCAHRKVVNLSDQAKPVSINIAQIQLQVTPYKRVSFNNKHDVIMFKFQTEAIANLKVTADQIKLTSSESVYRVLNEQELKTFATQEEGYDSSSKKGFPIGASYNQGKLLNYFQEKRLIERMPSSTQPNYFYEFFLIPAEVEVSQLKLNGLSL